MITFDLTGVCNLNCTMCVWHNGKMKFEKKKHLSFSQIRSTVNQVLMNKIKYNCINLSVSGEPLLNPEFLGIVTFLFDQNKNNVLFDVLSINTNATQLNEETVHFFADKALLNCGRLFLTCSLNSASKETGLAVKKRDVHDIIEANIQYLISYKRYNNIGDQLKIDLQMLVLKETADEAPLFVQKWSDCFRENKMNFRVVADEFCNDHNVINLKREFDKDRQEECDQRFKEVANRLNLLPKKIEKIYEKSFPLTSAVVAQRRPCHALWQTPIIRSDGRISFCLSDIDGHMEIGASHETDFLSRWLGKSANHYRLLHVMGKAENISVCSHCTYYEAGEVSQKYWDEYLQIMDSQYIDKKKNELGIQRFNSLPNKLLTIDISNACNLYCFYCTFAQEDKHSNKKKKFINLEEIKKICNEFLVHGTTFQCIVLSVSGEPLLNPHFLKIISYFFEINGTSQRLFKYISINTNATFLDKTKVDLIHDYIEKGYGQLQLTLSLNSASQESFLKTKKVDLYEQTLQNILYLLEEKARRKIDYQENIYLLFLVNEMVEHEALKFRDLWSRHLQNIGLDFSVDYGLPTKKSVSIIFKRTYSNSKLFTLPQSEYDEMHRRVVELLGLKPNDSREDLNKNIPVFIHTKKKCASPWLSPVIRHDGTLSYCLQDNENAMPIGNIFDHSFFDLWLSKTSKQFRQRLALNEFNKWDICKDCNYFDGEELPREVLESYKKQEKK